MIFSRLRSRLPLFGRRRGHVVPALAARLIGHSHAQMIFEAAADAGFPLEGFNFWTAPQPALSEDRSAFHPEIAAVLGEGVVFSAVGGAVHNIIGLVRHPVPFDFTLPTRPDLPVIPDAALLPHDAVVAMMMVQLQEYLDIIGVVRTTARAAVYHIEPPPPLEDNARLLVDVPWDFFPDLTREVSPPTLRLKLWMLATDIVRRYCSERDVGFIDHPTDAVDEKGYLRPEFYGDAMHVNKAYGALVVEQLRRLA